ncbi:MAG: type II toxin-antitoxin system PemK/MazF family toxin [Clostridia bacterium]|nr:type II toxin-antitoxin system PemK/MazF family toxin [Clostridia bacterium]
MDIVRGEIYYADLSPVVGSEQGGIRPVLVIQNNIGNKYSPTIIIAAITSQLSKAKLPTHIELNKDKYNLGKDSVVLLEQIRTLDKRRLRDRISKVDDSTMQSIDVALMISLGVVAD